MVDFNAGFDRVFEEEDRTPPTFADVFAVGTLRSELSRHDVLVQRVPSGTYTRSIRYGGRDVLSDAS